jgi:acetyl/propionyl-CoA carboxylase alpha subunit
LDRIIVPNRGEIAVRIARACREMGITSVLAHSDLDDISFTRRFFDDAVSLGESYLDVAKVIDAARRANADALHPGYGFLSERAELAAACEKAGITFIGPDGVESGVAPPHAPPRRPGGPRLRRRRPIV